MPEAIHSEKADDCRDDQLIALVEDEGKLNDIIGAALPQVASAIVRQAARAVVQAVAVITDAKYCPYCGDIIEPEADTCGGIECEDEEAAFQAELVRLMPS